MHISVFTPTHNVAYLEDAYRSLRAQVYQDWEWVVMLNNGAVLSRDFALRLAHDERVHVHQDDTPTPNVGYWKGKTIMQCTGDILVELDHDDMMTPDCLSTVLRAFNDNPWASLVYSNTVQVDEGGNPDLERFDAPHGWQYEEVLGDDIYPATELQHRGKNYLMAKALKPTPHNVSLIWYAPNHVRAFTRAAYDAAGGYTDMHVLDDQDLMCRLFAQGDFYHIDKPLYLQRTHPGMTQRDEQINPLIQIRTWDFYEENLDIMLRSWSQRQGLLALDLGCGNAKSEGYIGVDRYELEGVDVVMNLPSLAQFEDNSVGVIRMIDSLEHVADQIAMMEEIWRVLVPGGMLLTLTPSTDGRGAFQDPTHVSFWNENSWWYWTDDTMRDYSPQHGEQRAKFQVSRLRTYFPTAWHAEHNISYVQANVIAVKQSNEPRNGGHLLVELADPEE